MKVPIEFSLHHSEDDVVRVQSTVRMNSGMHSLYLTRLQNCRGCQLCELSWGGGGLDFLKECEEHRREQGFVTLTVHCLVVLQ